MVSILCYDNECRVIMSSPDQFFTTVKDSGDNKLCKWVGELYLELHRGTYTTQAKVNHTI